MFKDQVVWITGGSSGIGEALALEFAAAGSRIVLSARREKELNRVRERCIEAGGGADDVLVLPLDVTDHDAMPAAVQKVVNVFGRIDLLINNAGISQRSLCVDTDMSVYRKLFEIDVLGQIALTKAVLPGLLEQGSGHIAITSSVAGKIGVPKRTGYCAAKHAVMGFYDALRAEMAPRGIRVTTITPGFIRTNISVNALKGDGSEFGEVDGDIAGGMDVTRCARVIMDGFRKGTPEIAVGEGMEMKALWLKRFFPAAVFKKVEKMA
ncbi:MAG: SDR family oxidoreductase [Xanthomonadales bacterium]|nr:SDR family oxidoreductase [Gammaproteobacteria bacterium]MBT8053489.1 SDR family oxidoreductase [Gammaproteobacteria bacterium]NND55857.1 SDR family oxidoreductase [Xanthomonadales bacterium]NNK50923.1 SDR family oxidoreductase [Xanthomonadales bacterium]